MRGSKKEGIAVQFEAEPGVTGTDAGTMQVQRVDAPAVWYQYRFVICIRLPKF